MCKNKHWITNPYNGKQYFVSCGHCEACLQQKAINRTNRIRNTQSYGRVFLFVTLTYDNDFVPYVYESNLQAFNCNWAEHLNVYRDADRKWTYDINEDCHRYETVYRQTKLIKQYDTSIISAFDRYYSQKNDEYKYLRYRLPDGTFTTLNGKIGVCFLPDFQKFIKRLRYYLEEEGYNEKLVYFYCSEYGVNFGRPHFHTLLDVPCEAVSKVTRAVHKAWPYDNFKPGSKQYERMCEQAFNASSYVSSYVNGFSSLPYFFKVAKPFRSTHHYSHAFGISCKHFSLLNIIDMFRKADFTYSETVFKNGIPSPVTLHMPAYVLHRFFPTFKGYTKLPSHALYNLANGFEDFSKYGCANFCNIRKKDRRKYEVMLHNARLRFEKQLSLSGFDYDYGKIYAKVWDVYKSSRLKFAHSKVTEDKQYFEFYDNIEDYLSGNISNELLDFCLSHSNKIHYETDPNNFEDNIRTHATLCDYYYKYDKRRKMKDIVISADDHRF